MRFPVAVSAEKLLKLPRGRTGDRAHLGRRRELTLKAGIWGDVVWGCTSLSGQSTLPLLWRRRKGDEEGEEGREDVHREVRKASENSYPLLALKN